MPEDVMECPCCAERRSVVFDRRHFRGYEVVNRICSNCGLVFQSPRMTSTELEKLYAGEYRQLYPGEEGPSAKDIYIQRRRAEFLLNYLRSNGLNSFRRHLDIGSSAGSLLETFQANYGCESYGIEPGTAYREYSQRRGLKVFTDLEELIEADETGFDLITMAHVLEHLPDPLSFLRILHDRVLGEDGWLLIEVPNLYAHDCFELAHMVSFSASTLSQILKMSGFRPTHMIKHGHPRSRVLPLYLTAIARKEKGISGYLPRREVGVLFKRRTGMIYRRIVSKLFPRQAWLSLPFDLSHQVEQ